MRDVVIRDGIVLGSGHDLVVFAGPCVIEDEPFTLHMAEQLKEVCAAAGVGFVFKSSFDKANRSSLASFRGPGIDKGLEVLARVREEVQVPVITDIHEPWQASRAAEAVDVLQIPAFLCRQTDLLVAAAETGAVVNVKKGQFLAPKDMTNVVTKLESAGCDRILLTERGASFGYNTLVVDFRGLPQMRELGWPVVFDATHSVQMPGGLGTASGGERQFVPHLARAAAAVGIDGLFMEVHEDPDAGLSDGPNMVRLADVPDLLAQVCAIREAVAAR